MEDIVKYRASTVADGPDDGGEYDYCLFKDSTMLLGVNAFEELQMYTGGGQNGKTTEVQMKCAVYGKLMNELKPDYYQSGTTDPNKASSFLMKVKYCKCIYSEEPSNERQPIYGGRIKKLCGRNYLDSEN